VCAAAAPGPAQADSATCQTAISVQLQKFKKLSLKTHVKCLRLENIGKITGCTTDCCPDATAQLKIQTARDNATTAIAAACALAGGTQAACIVDPTVSVQLGRAADAKDALIKRKCGNRVPMASPPFCCVTGTGQDCTVVTTRTDCTNIMGTVTEGKTCDPMM